MAKEELIEFDGEVLELLPNAHFRVKLENGHQFIAHTSGRMRRKRVEARAGIEPAIEDLQSTALPFCYLAKLIL